LLRSCVNPTGLPATGGVRKFRVLPLQSWKKHPMDIERLNAVGTLLADLSARTEQLRGYL
jgi:hypothetical protein